MPSRLTLPGPQPGLGRRAEPGATSDEHPFDAHLLRHHGAHPVDHVEAHGGPAVTEGDEFGTARLTVSTGTEKPIPRSPRGTVDRRG